MCVASKKQCVWQYESKQFLKVHYFFEKKQFAVDLFFKQVNCLLMTVKKQGGGKMFYATDKFYYFCGECLMCKGKGFNV